MIPDGASKYKPGDAIPTDDDPRECPFCLRALYWVRTGGLIHVRPTCEPFDRLDVEDFIHAAAQRVGN